MISDLGGVSQKSIVRKSLRDRLRAFALDSELKSAADGRIVSQLLYFISSRPGMVAGFLPFAEEPELSSFYTSLTSSSLVFPKLLPGVEGQEMGFVSVASYSSEAWEISSMGFRQPSTTSVVVPAKAISIMLVPGLGFSSFGERLGRGKGFYDRYLSRFAGLKVGVCFDCQLSQQALPTDSWDIKMNFIITESKCLEIKE